ncbi:MAG: glycosyl hydrolase family 28-related protein [Segniliparus sp.]|uniref:glycosyl hydrolase family 28-related protein n=1 Tax=Segniliparus sp. TaxID=2804064 RepID=UPI003F392787
MTERPRISRRGALRYGVGTGLAGASAAAAAACSADHPAQNGHKTAEPANVMAFGAVGDGKADDTAAVEKAVRSGGDHVSLHFPTGTYRVTSFPELPDFATLTGAGPGLSVLLYEGDRTLIALRDKQRVSFARLGIFVTGPAGEAVRLSNSFRCSFDTVTLRGNHVGANFPQYQEQRGLVLDENTGGTSLINCDINNFGVGLTTKCIQNYVTNCKFTVNRTSVLGSGGDHTAGLSITNTEFVSDGDEQSTEAHIRIDGAANDWFLTNVWFEGCDIAASIGSAGGGPAQFGLVNAKIAARKTGIALNYCRQPYLANISFDEDTGQTAGPRALDIDPAGCPNGVALGLISGTSDDLPIAAFPAGWSVTTRHGSLGGRVITPMTMTAPIVADSSLAAPVLADPEGSYWQLAVDTSGNLTTRPLGKTPPK